MMRSWLLLALALPLTACPQAPAEPEPTPTPTPVDVLPAVIPLDWLQNLSGTVIHHQEYFGPDALAGTTCEEQFTANGANITGFEPNPCEQCELVFSLFLNQENDCVGDDVLDVEGHLGLDLRQAAGESVFWWYNNGLFGWGAGWSELGTGTLVQNPDDLTLDVHFEFEDPRNSDNGPSTQNGDECGWFGADRCRWHGTYIIDLQLEMDEGQIVWDQEQPEG